MAFSPPAAARPWTFRLMVLIVAGVVTVAGLVGRATLARRADARAHETLIADLRRFDAAQRGWEARRGEFAIRYDATGSDEAVAFTPSPGVNFRFESRSPQAWSATVTGSAEMAAPRTCGIFRGEGPIAPHRALTNEGMIACW